MRSSDLGSHMLTTMSDSFMDRRLPPQVLSVLPSESHLQLELAHSITCHAYSQKVSKLEAETGQLHSELVQSQQTVKSLEGRLVGMEAELIEQQQRARQCMSEQHKLVAEKNALIETVKRLNREVARLEHFKRNLLQQLQDDCEGDGPGSAYAAVDMTTERLVSEVLNSADGIAAAAEAAAAAGPDGRSGSHYHHQQQQQAGGGGYQQRQPQQLGSGHGSWSPPAQGGRLQGPGSPSSNMYSSVGYASNTAAAGADGNSGSPYRGVRLSPSAAKDPAVLGSRSGIPAGGSGAASAAAHAMGPAGGQAAGSGGGARGLTAAANAALGGPRFASPPQAGTGRGSGAGGRAAATSPRIDGKEFFRQARARLSYEQFSQFLVAIKELNAGRTSREDTLGTAKALFGANNSDLYRLFEGLLMRHLTSF